MKIDNFLLLFNMSKKDNIQNNSKTRNYIDGLNRVENRSLSFRGFIGKCKPLYQADKEARDLESVKNKIFQWIKGLPLNEKRDLLINEYTSITHKFIDSKMIGILDKGGVNKTYKNKIVEDVSSLRGAENIKFKQGGPGFVTQQVNVFCMRDKLDSIKDSFIKEKCNKMIIEICQTLAVELGICVPSELEKTLCNSHENYLIEIGYTQTNAKHRMWNIAVNVSSRRSIRLLDGVNKVK